MRNMSKRLIYIFFTIVLAALIVGITIQGQDEPQLVNFITTLGYSK